MDKGHLAIVVATVRPAEATAFMASLLVAGQPDSLIFVFQGSNSAFRELAGRAEHIAREHGFRRLQVIHDSGHGVSRARNVGMDAIEVAEAWVWMPNDTVRVRAGLPAALADACARIPSHVAAVAGRYTVSTRPARNWPDGATLSGWTLFAEPAEPATLWRLDALRAAGGFDERLGTGGTSWAQAMEGADLLFRLERRGWSTVTSGFTVTGTRMHTPADRIVAWTKSFYYGVGYGLVARRHGHAARAAVNAFHPLSDWLVRRLQGRAGRELGDAVAIAAGRTVGLVLGEAVCRAGIPHRSRPGGARDWIGRPA